MVMSKIEKIYTKTINKIKNESMLDDVLYAAEQAKCDVETKNYTTTAIVKGTQVQIEKFINLYNK